MKKLFLISGILVVFCLGLGIGYKVFKDTALTKTDSTTSPILLMKLCLNSFVVGPNAGGISLMPDNNSIAFLFNYTTKEIGIVHFPWNKKLPFTEKYGSQMFEALFKKISLTEQEQIRYPLIDTEIFYQPIKEVDFDTFMILPGGFYAIDKNNIYTLSNFGNADNIWRGDRDYTSPVDENGNYYLYYHTMPSEIDRNKFQIFRNFFLVQKDGVYAFGNKLEDVVIPSRFIHDNTPEEI